MLSVSIACSDDDKNENEAPDTFFSIEEINLTGDNRLNSIVRLTWFGTDPDGYIKGYELSEDGINWDFTTVQDSTFQFNIAAGADTSDIRLFVRSIDNENLVDPTPDELTIPIRNTPPTVTFDDDLTIPDTAYLAATTEWNATDIDGDETITQVLISLNGAAWYEVSRTKKIFTLVPADDGTTSGITNAKIYYNNDANPASEEVEGLIVNDTNYILIKAVDQAGTESAPDTSYTFYMKGKQNDLLVIGGIRATPGGSDPAQLYSDILQRTGTNFDFVDFTIDNGLYQPKLWNTTFRLQLSFYSKLFFFSDDETFINNFTNTRLLLLEYAAASLQEYANSGGKYLVSTSFPWDTNIDGFRGILPLSSLSSVTYGGSNGTNLSTDSAITSTLPGYPDLSSSSFRLPAIGVYNIDSLDSEVLYTAGVTMGRRDPWTDTKIIASGRRNNGKLNQVYFGVQLWQLDKDPAELDALFNQILNVEFN